MASDDHPEDNMDNLLAVGVIVLKQAVDFVQESVTTDEQLTFRSKFIPGSTIGKHLRHARDHYVLLLESVNSNPSSYIGSEGQPESMPSLSYDMRTRNTPMEASRTSAIEALQSCILQLEEIVPKIRKDARIKLHAVTPFEQVFETTFARELWFAALHAVHHWSMVRVIAAEQNMSSEESFGIAPSTLVYHDREAALGKSKSKI
ncbi:hypothetical protein SCHPADRAFT_934359 [Schizopora paradoxa]|uniref:DinB-like domain-containing protein n=1 Tax=Schizopora paradoxa TaxID=27342 RepID=A0A0H2S8A6_9AGAM|nr:hypothetical protein SCHPADRAFT_934359 [Schizopora paradoxa]